jgi:hypothetical protein
LFLSGCTSSTSRFLALVMFSIVSSLCTPTTCGGSQYKTAKESGTSDQQWFGGLPLAYVRMRSQQCCMCSFEAVTPSLIMVMGCR